MKDAEILEVTYWHEGLADWAELASGTQLPTNTPMTIAVHSKNSGDETFNIRTYLKITDPGGGVLVATPDVYHVPLELEEDTWIYFDNITFTSLGVYEALIEDKEYGEDTALDSVALTLNVETSPVDVIGSVMPLVGIVFALGILGMMVNQAKEVVI